MTISLNILLPVFRKLFTQNRARSVEEITYRYAPFAIGLNNNGLMVPTPNILRGNASSDLWCDTMALYEVKHLQYWITACAAYDPSTLIIDFMSELSPVACQQHYLPFIEYIPRPEQVLVKTGPMIELVHIYNLSTVGDLAAYLYSIIILGVFLNDYIANDILMIQNVQEFIASRLFQGEIDGIMMKDLGHSVSTFLPGFGADQGVYNSEPFYQNLQGKLSPSEFNDLVRREKITIMNAKQLGNESPQVIAMKHLLQLSSSYMKYVETRGPLGLPKVGPKEYESIALASSTRKEILFKPPDQMEVHRKPFREHTLANTGSASREVIPEVPVGATVPLFGSHGAVNGQYMDLKNS